MDYSHHVAVLEGWVKTMQEISSLPFTPRDFDCFCGGYVAGLTLSDKPSDEVEEIRKIIDILVNSEVAKSVFGVTGTIAEKIVVSNFENKR